MRAAASAKSADLLGKKDSAGFVCRLANSTARKSLIVSKDSRIMDFPKAPSIAEQGRVYDFITQRHVYIAKLLGKE